MKTTAGGADLNAEWMACRRAWKSPIPTTAMLAQYDALVEKLMGRLQALEADALRHLSSVLNTQPSYSLARAHAEEAARKFLADAARERT